MSILSPVVPDVPGVPALLPSGVTLPQPAALTSDSTSAQLGAGAAQWGIFNADGTPALIADSVLSVEYKKDWQVSDYPVEQGNFESYNKVRLPYESRVTFTRGGTEADRSDFLQTLEDIADSLDLYDVVTPERTYTNANITHFDYRRTSSNGVSLLTVSVWLQEIRSEASTAFTQTAQPSGADKVNGGTVQTTTATPVQKAVVNTGAATGSW
jgi:hypothetical protein